jgi:hypothetical protein
MDKFVTQALKDYEMALNAQGKVDIKTMNNIYLRGAKDFAQFLRTGSPLKREQRAPIK